jgi:hypothetical protein
MISIRRSADRSEPDHHRKSPARGGVLFAAVLACEVDHIQSRGLPYRWAQSTKATHMVYLTLMAAAFAPFGFMLGRSIAQRSFRSIAPMRRLG